MNAKANGIARDGSMSLRMWAKSRRVPLSSAHRAVSSGRIDRLSNGRIDPLAADRTWRERTRPRIGGRVPQPPAGPLDPVQDRDPDWRGDPGAEQITVRVVDAVQVVEELQSVLAAALVSMVNRIAPKLVGKTEHAVRQGLEFGLEQAWCDADAEWRRRHPLEDAAPGNGQRPARRAGATQ